MAIPPILQIFLQTYGLAYSFVLMGSMLAFTALFTLLLKKPIPSVKGSNLYEGLLEMAFLGSVKIVFTSENESGHEKSSGFFSSVRQAIMPFLAVFKAPATVILLTSFIFLGLTFSVVIAFTPDRGNTFGLDPLKTSYLLSIIGICNFLGRIGIGLALDWFRDHAVAMIGVLMLINGAVVAGSVFLTSFAGQVAYACIFGLAFGAYVSSLVVVLKARKSLDI